MIHPHNQQQASVSDETLALLRRLRIQYRDRPAVYRDLLWITGIASATELVCGNEYESNSTLSTQQAADLTGLKPVTIRKACAEKRLHGTKDGRDWRITRAALAEWMARRAA
ncbi:DNA-binding protein [Nonomuraea deserti]|uniref:DNA-binding protein n=1 Tax=Nonomuraea deserti TaxID=1848322 RepID=A0A4R4V9G7_9ACTN|nr:helix-turn-helix domain-containing protein [Nonomuraea deserti]TDC98504.1 DNA-binding protein [Nonomuraea deserti]